LICLPSLLPLLTFNVLRILPLCLRILLPARSARIFPLPSFYPPRYHRITTGYTRGLRSFLRFVVAVYRRLRITVWILRLPPQLPLALYRRYHRFVYVPTHTCWITCRWFCLTQRTAAAVRRLPALRLWIRSPAVVCAVLFTYTAYRTVLRYDLRCRYHLLRFTVTVTRFVTLFCAYYRFVGSRLVRSTTCRAPLITTYRTPHHPLTSYRNTTRSVTRWLPRPCAFGLPFAFCGYVPHVLLPDRALCRVLPISVCCACRGTRYVVYTFWLHCHAADAVAARLPLVCVRTYNHHCSCSGFFVLTCTVVHTCTVLRITHSSFTGCGFPF